MIDADNITDEQIKALASYYERSEPQARICRVTGTQYDAIKNDRSCSVITFNRSTQTRLGTVSGLTMVQAMVELLRVQAQRSGDHVEVLVLRCLPEGDSCAWDRADYDECVKASMFTDADRLFKALR